MHLVDLIVYGMLLPTGLFLALLTMRHWAPIVRQAFRAFVDRYAAANSEPGLVLERSRLRPYPLVRPDTDQAGADQTEVTFADIADYLAQHNLTDEQLIILYARARRAPDDYPLSANKIRDAVGGSRDEVLAAIAAERPRPPQPKLRRLERPANGW